MNRLDRISLLKKSLQNRILVLDGAMGTALQNLSLTAQDFGGEELDGCNENLVRTRPDVIAKVHRDYLVAGADIVETNTFGATPLVLDEYGLGHYAYEINRLASEIAMKECVALSTSEKPRFVAGSMGPTTKSISVTGGVTFEDLQAHYFEQARGLYDGGADYFLLETCQDTRNIKAAFLALDRFEEELRSKNLPMLPTALSVTIEAMGTMLAGQTVEALYASVAHKDLLYIGLNCATGPEFMTDHIRSLARISRFPIACVPNAGLPDENGCYLESPEMVKNIVQRFIDQSWINVLGGCCGTHPGHISALASLALKSKPRTPVDPQKDVRSFLSGVDYLEVTDELRPVIVGERSNVIGSKKFKDLICAEQFEDASEVARGQIKNGASIVDICLANPDRDEIQDMRMFLDASIRKIRVPLMIDSTDEKVIELALSYSQGKAIINSINLEDGEERFEKVVPLAKKYGAALVVGTIDDDSTQGMGVTVERKLQIAQRSFDLLTRKYGIRPEDIYWDPLVFPCATGDEQYRGSAKHTIEGVRALKAHFPTCKTVLGISNVSFGLPAAGREVLNSVFLYHCVQAGLDLALVNSEKLIRYTQITDEERTLAEDLLFDRSADPIAAFAAHFREKKVRQAVDRNTIPIDERLSRAVVEGSKEGLVEDLAEKLKTQSPMDIINGPLMKGMDEVGRLFNANKLIVAEVLQSAEVMKTAVTFLEPHMEKKDSAVRGSVMLATVKGDVHDIGKNLVEIVLANNGFKVINLGIKVPPERLIQEIRSQNPDIVGLSGLLVKSAQQMVITAEDFSKANIQTPVLVGGAALSERFVDTRIAKAYSGTVIYASDAMHGLDLAKTIVDREKFQALRETIAKKREERDKQTPKFDIPAPAEMKRTRSPAVELAPEIPAAPDFDRHILRNTPIDQIWKFINPLMLYGRHLGVKGSSVRLLGTKEIQTHDPKAHHIWEIAEEVKKEYRDSDIMRPAAVYQFLRAHSQGNSLVVWSDSGQSATFEFPRQRTADTLCLSDYIEPQGGRPDHLAAFAVTVGKGVREISESLKNRGDYLKSHIVQALAIESAEAYAEFIHSQIRKMWGFPDAPDMTMMQRFQAKYRGKRYSFGYPACPRLEDQKILWALLNPTEIGIQLTDGFMMDPEASVSAIVFHHPQASYFSVGTTGDGGADENRK